jgi:CubicO group peptidase (beta-lactamase class C family)
VPARHQNPGEIDRLLKEAADSRSVPGVIAVAVDRSGATYEGSAGVRDLSTRVPMTVDSVLWYASMTKALVSTGAMQLVEQGRVDLDEPVARVVPGLKNPTVLEGYGADGKPKLRPARRPITLRHLLTHTAGFGYDIWNADVLRYMRENDIPLLVDCKLSSLDQPLACEPGERWEYGISIDWVGQVIETLSGKSLHDYLAEHLFKPLGMTDATFLIRPEQRKRLATVHQRDPNRSLRPIKHEISQEPEFFMGGGGIYGTARDYGAYVQMLLNDGRSRDGVQVLRPETVRLMGENSIGDIKAGVLKPVLPELSCDVDFFPGIPQKWGLGFLINMEDAPAGRSAGSLTWAGLANTYFWVDRKKGVGGVIMTQILPFADPITLKLYDAFERKVYGRQAAAA